MTTLADLQTAIDVLPTLIVPGPPSEGGTGNHRVHSQQYPIIYQLLHDLLEQQQEINNALPILVVASGGDDTDRIQAIIDVASPSARLLFAARDNFTVGNLLDNGKRIIFDGQGATITTTNRGGSPFVLTGVGSQVLGFTIDCTLQPDHHGIEADGIADVVIDRVTIINAAGWGIVASECDNIKIRDCYVKDSGDAGIFLTSSALHRNYEVRGCIVDRRGVSVGASGGIILRGVAPGDVGFIQAAKITDNWVYLPVADGGVCIETTWCPFVNVSDNYVEGGGIGVSVAQSPDSHADRNSVNAATVTAVELAGSRYTTANGNVIDGQIITSAGVGLNGDGDFTPIGCTINGNTIRNCTGNAIDAHNGAEVTIVGNRILNAGTGNALISMTNAHNSTVAGNVINGNGTGKFGIFMDTTNNVSITGNTIFGHTDEPVYYYAGAAYTVTVGMVATNSFALNGSTTPGVAGTVTIDPAVVWGPNSAI